MYHLFKENKLISSSDIKEILWDEAIYINFTQEEIQKLHSWYSYNIETWEFEETEESKNFEKQTLENEKTQIEKELVEVNGLIEWAKKLKEMWIFDEDDEIELVWYETKAQELITKRAEIKVKIKELWN